MPLLHDVRRTRSKPKDSVATHLHEGFFPANGRTRNPMRRKEENSPVEINDGCTSRWVGPRAFMSCLHY